MIKKLFLIISMFFISVFGFLNFSYSSNLDKVLGSSSEAKDYQIKEIKIDESLVSRTAKFLLGIATMIGIAVFLYGGIRFFFSMGDDGKAKKTRDLLIVSGIGLIIAFGSWSILQIILSAGGSIVSGQ